MDEIIELGKPIKLNFISPDSPSYSIYIEKGLQCFSDSISVDREYFDSVIESLKLIPKEKIKTELISY